MARAFCFVFSLHSLKLGRYAQQHLLYLRKKKKSSEQLCLSLYINRSKAFLLPFFWRIQGYKCTLWPRHFFAALGCSLCQRFRSHTVFSSVPESVQHRTFVLKLNLLHLSWSRPQKQHLLVIRPVLAFFFLFFLNTKVYFFFPEIFPWPLPTSAVAVKVLTETAGNCNFGRRPTSVDVSAFI